MRSVALSQEKIVFLIAIAMFCAFSFLLNGFLSAGNLLSLVRSVSTLGILGVGMAFLVIGRGIDLAIVAIYAMSAAWTLHLADGGLSIPLAMLIGYLFALSAAWSAASSSPMSKSPRCLRPWAWPRSSTASPAGPSCPLYVVYMPPSGASIGWIGGGFLFGVPTPILFFAAVALLGHGLLRFTKPGRFIYALGDNFAAARISGAPVRPIIILQYAISASIAYVAGMITATAVASMDTNVANSSMIYDVILVVVLGGVGLSGGRGGIRNVIVGTLLIGILLNGMTIMNIQYTLQNVIRSLILLIAIVIDSVHQSARRADRPTGRHLRASTAKGRIVT